MQSSFETSKGGQMNKVFFQGNSTKEIKIESKLPVKLTLEDYKAIIEKYK